MYNLHIVIVRSLELWSERQFRVFAQLLIQFGYQSEQEAVLPETDRATCYQSKSCQL